jgi:flagellar export protein FliJ
MIYRLIDIKQRAAEATETAHVAAHLATEEAETALRDAIAGWKAFAESPGVVTSAADLEDRDRQYKWLRTVIDRAEKSVRLARADEATKRERMTEARIELRRYETWLENTKALRKAEAARVQRLADDEVAARKALAGPQR